MEAWRAARRRVAWSPPSRACWESLGPEVCSSGSSASWLVSHFVAAWWASTAVGLLSRPPSAPRIGPRMHVLSRRSPAALCNAATACCRCRHGPSCAPSFQTHAGWPVPPRLDTPASSTTPRAYSFSLSLTRRFLHLMPSAPAFLPTAPNLRCISQCGPCLFSGPHHECTLCHTMQQPSRVPQARAAACGAAALHDSLRSGHVACGATPCFPPLAAWCHVQPTPGCADAAGRPHHQIAVSG